MIIEERQKDTPLSLHRSDISSEKLDRKGRGDLERRGRVY